MPRKRVRQPSEQQQNDAVNRSTQRKKPKKSPVVEEELVSLIPSRRRKAAQRSSVVNADDSFFIGDPFLADEAKTRWPHRYAKNDGSSDDDTVKAKFHYREVNVDGVIYKLNDNAYVKGEEGKENYIAAIVELFVTHENEYYFTAQWFYRAEDTVIKNHGDLIDEKRIFKSDVKDENPLDCLVKKVNIVQISPDDAKEKNVPPCDLYYDMKYTLPYLTFSSIDNEPSKIESETDKIESETSTISSESGSNACATDNNVAEEGLSKIKESDREWTLLDLYSGCGAMSTGLCFGASIADIKLVTRWAVDTNEYACESLKLNHPETQVRNETTEDFLSLLKEWFKLCEKFVLNGTENIDSELNAGEEAGEEADDEAMDSSSDSEVFEVERLVSVCYGDPNEDEKAGLYFKVQWKGYDTSYDTWEPIEGLSDCKEAMKEFVTKGYEDKILPLPGQADFICGGPPCQGISGFNRFRDKNAPMDDIKNKQLIVYMDIIEFLKPKYILMENVVDILKFAGGYLGRYAVGRLVAMHYQARMGMMAAGSYGLPQFRMRFFLWGALPTQNLPSYPLPTHEVISRSVIPKEFEEITVAYTTNEKCQLAPALYLGDAIDDLPPVENDDSDDEKSYGTTPRTDFQRYIRLKRSEMVNYTADSESAPSGLLYDHRPYLLNNDDYERVCLIPKKKGANFRDLKGVLVKEKKVEWDPSVERVYLKSGKPLVPNYAMKFVRGTSSKPFGRLWWDEIVSTVVTRAEPHNQALIHPKQDRVLTIRENARLQGFPDCYKLCGPIKERYIQVGNAVAVPVGLALGYTLGLALQGRSGDNPLTTLPFKYPSCLARPLAVVDDDGSS
ncbi:putative DNA (cytosine-5-)-methyltransferase [Medicago truncatula]|uniref:DNA (cytosine-5-)-methyltransferase n=1 Tax=Medicago truncatula TaxID=3880 RepID=A0A072UIN2_MEDTR|nr:DNA (cytosine-5)-methyltransferase CMT3 [Medicago truncatula]KEH28933.1 DNA (cytosine-5)-methyltransferase CMT1 [Medicago truncatula]RHN58926.1 putative DNA (cytosine-5-)-methyltransferase [Medicago truncatula]